MIQKGHPFGILLEQTYQDLNDSLTVTLHNESGNEVKNNGMLFPNWYGLDGLTGYPTDAIQPNDYQFGYDAFRTIWFLAYDYYLSKEPRDKEILAKVYPFFKNELTQHGKICPVYTISGTQEECDYETQFGFYAVYLTLFQLMGDKDNENLLLQKYADYRHSAENRVWTKSGGTEVKEGETEYFMNFWTFFGGYLYLLNSSDDNCATSGNVLIEIGNACDYQRVMNWAESIWLDLFAQQNKQELSIEPFQVRFYPATNIYLGYNIQDNRFYGYNLALWGPNIVPFGLLSEYLPMAQASGF